LGAWLDDGVWEWEIGPGPVHGFMTRNAPMPLMFYLHLVSFLFINPFPSHICPGPREMDIFAFFFLFFSPLLWGCHQLVERCADEGFKRAKNLHPLRDVAQNWFA